MTSERQKRIKRIKFTIIIVLLIAILLPTVLCIILICRMNHLEQRLSELSAKSQDVNVTMEEKAAVLPAQSISENIVDETDTKDTRTKTENPEDMSDDTYKMYLTFDDGPSQYTEDILKILKEYDVKATFFVVGKEEPSLRDVYQKITADGHTIGMHSYSHQYSQIYDSKEAFQEDLHKIRSLIYDETGVMAKYYRFPGGSSNRVSKLDMSVYIDCLNQEGIEYIDWNISTQDATEPSLSADEIVENTFENFGRYHTNVVLLHDTGKRQSTVEALPQIIEKARDMGIELLPIEDTTIPIQHIQIEE